MYLGQTLRYMARLLISLLIVFIIIIQYTGYYNLCYGIKNK